MTTEPGQAVRVRHATASDSVLLAAIGGETFRETFADANTPADMALYLGQAFGAEQQAREIAAADALFLIAERGGEPVGYARITWGPRPPAARPLRQLEIVRFYVRKPWIGSGVGAAMMRACLREAVERHCDVVSLAVWEHNTRARAFYERWGFHPAGEQVFVLGSDPQRDLVMMRRAHAFTVARCRPVEFPDILTTVNAAAEAYRGVIAADRWTDPYMPAQDLRGAIAAGVRFWGAYDEDGGLVGVMGLQDVEDVTLIRHAYTRPARQRQGVGTALLAELRRQSRRPLLVGTWRAATWAVRFYESHGFTRVADDEQAGLLRRYWTIPERQVQESVVLAQAASGG